MSKRIKAALVALSFVLVLPCVAQAQMPFGGMGGLMGGGMGGGMNPLLNSAATGPSVQQMRGVAEKANPTDIIREVTKSLNTDADPRERVRSLNRIRYLKQPEVTDLLLQGLVDPDARVRIKAVDILGARRVKEGVPVMSQYLFLRSTEPAVKLHMVAALGRIADSEATLPIIQYLQESKDPRSRGTAVFALGEIGDQRASQALTKTATEDDSTMVRRLAQEALEKIEGEVPTAKARWQMTHKRAVTTDQKLAKLREFDMKMQQMKR